MSDPVCMDAQTERRLAGVERLVTWITPRLKSDHETCLTMILAFLSEAHACGIDDAADVVERCNAAHPSHDLRVVGKALRDLAKLNRATPENG